jgi:hypothetical protein
MPAKIVAEALAHGPDVRQYRDMDITLYRAAETDDVTSGMSFAVSCETAELYLDNPGFGGAHLYETEVSPAASQVVDLRGLSLEAAQALAGVSGERGAIGVDEWLPRDVGAQDALRARGYEWALVSESYPVGTTTWVWIGESLSDGEPVLYDH